MKFCRVACIYFLPSVNPARRIAQPGQEVNRCAALKEPARAQTTGAMTEPDALFETAVTHFREHRAEDAEAACLEILGQLPGHARALHLLGIVRGAKDIQEGLRLIRRATAANPDYAEAHFNLAAMLAAAGQPAEAAKHYAEVMRLKPDDLVAHIRRGALLTAAGETDEAIDQYRAVLVRWPDSVPALLGLGGICLTRGELLQSIDLHRRAAQLAPNSAEVAACFGRALKYGGDQAGAIAQYRRALTLEADQLDALNFLAVALFEQGELTEAGAVIARACARRPDNPASHFNAALIAQATGDLAAARKSLQRALDLEPGNPLYRRVSLATALYDPDMAETARADAHRSFGAQVSAAAAKLPPPPNLPDPSRRLRVGWLSSDFRDHPVARNLGPIFAQYDRTAFEMHLYGEVLKPDDVTFRLRTQTDHWHSTIGESDRAVAERIRADCIDILVVLAGRFDRNRPEIAAWRAAPVQVSFHDPATSGMPAMDYLIADRRLAPRGGEEWFAERILALPTFYLHPAIEFSPEPGPLPMTRHGGITFGSFNHPAKVNDQVLRLWADVLREIRGSRMILKYRGYYAEALIRARVHRAAEAAGVDPERFVLLGEREDRNVHLARYREIDIAFDPFPFSGSTTTFESLWMGVPVVTWPGSNMASRWSAAMLHALQLDAWIANSPGSYVAIASALARNSAQLTETRGHLRHWMMRSPLCDAVRRTGQIERLFRAVWRRWCSQQVAAEPLSASNGVFEQ